jgi:hypothetical protein
MTNAVLTVLSTYRKRLESSLFDDQMKVVTDIEKKRYTYRFFYRF